MAEIFTARECLINGGHKDESGKSERKPDEFRDGLRAREGLLAACHGRATMTYVPKSQFGQTLEIPVDRIEPAVDLANRQLTKHIHAKVQHRQGYGMARDERSVATNSDCWCRSPTRLSTRWNSAVSSPVVSI